MWLFNNFATSFAISAFGSLGWDLTVNKFKHLTRSADETIRVAKRILPVALFNLCLSYPYFEFVEWYIRDLPRNDYGLVKNGLYTFLIADFGTYWLHRLFHSSKFLYQFHKVHHEFKYPISLGAFYADPVDFFVVNMFPFTLPIFLLHPDNYSIAIITNLFVIVTVLQAHGTYTFLSDAHLQHHLHYKVNYGLGLMDILMGTDTPRKRQLVTKKVAD